MEGFGGRCAPCGQWGPPLSLVINARPTFRVFVLRMDVYVGIMCVAPPIMRCTTAKCARQIYIVPFEWWTPCHHPLWISDVLDQKATLNCLNYPSVDRLHVYISIVFVLLDF